MKFKQEVKASLEEKILGRVQTLVFPFYQTELEKSLQDSSSVMRVLIKAIAEVVEEELNKLSLSSNKKFVR